MLINPSFKNRPKSPLAEYAIRPKVPGCILEVIEAESLQIRRWHYSPFGPWSRWEAFAKRRTAERRNGLCGRRGEYGISATGFRFPRPGSSSVVMIVRYQRRAPTIPHV